jgi:predicted XRE-type DNA-binding protein
MPRSRNTVDYERDLAVTQKLKLQNYSNAQIAEIVGVSAAQISYDLRKLNKHWREYALKERAAFVDQELQKLDLLENEAWQAWERSRLNSTETTEIVNSSKVEHKPKRSNDRNNSSGSGTYANGDRRPSVDIKTTTRTTSRIKTNYGDAQFLATVLRCMEHRMTLLGLEPPKAQAISEVKLIEEMISHNLLPNDVLEVAAQKSKDFVIAIRGAISGQPVEVEASEDVT